MPKVYEAGGTIEINKPDANLNFQNSTTFSLDYFDPTELETELKILQSDVLALHVIRELNLDRNSDLANQAPPSPSARSRTRPPASRPGIGRGNGRQFQGKSAESHSSRIHASSRCITAAPIPTGQLLSSTL